MILVANAAIGKRWAPHAIAILAGFSAGATFLFAAYDMTAPGSGIRNPTGVDVGTMVTAVAAAALASKPVRERVSRILPVDADNPVHSFAMVLAVILFGTQVASIAFTDVLAYDQALPPLTISDLIAQQVPFLVLAFAGVGLSIRRGAADSGARLGLQLPAWWQVALALGAAGLFFGASQASLSLSETFTPGIAQQVDKTTQHLFGGLGGPAGVLALALAPGICEEVLFRGALQPRFGLIVTAVLFTAIHTEYGLSFDVVTIFGFAIGLGLIRKYTNTTTSCACHVSYNLLAGIGWTGQALGLTLAGSVLLIALAGFEIVRRRRLAQPVNPPVP